METSRVRKLSLSPTISSSTWECRPCILPKQAEQSRSCWETGELPRGHESSWIDLTPPDRQYGEQARPPAYAIQLSWLWWCELRRLDLRVCEPENWLHALLSVTLGELALPVLENSARWWQWEKARRMTKRNSTQALNQNYGVAHPITHFICELLERVVGPDQQMQSYRVFVTQSNIGISKRGQSRWYSKSQLTLSRPMTLFNWRLKVKMDGLTRPHYSSQAEIIFICFFFDFVLILFGV